MADGPITQAWLDGIPATTEWRWRAHLLCPIETVTDCNRELSIAYGDPPGSPELSVPLAPHAFDPPTYMAGSAALTDEFLLRSSEIIERFPGAGIFVCRAAGESQAEIMRICGFRGLDDHVGQSLTIDECLALVGLVRAQTPDEFDSEPEHIQSSNLREAIAGPVGHIRSLVRADNSLTEADKRNIEGYLLAIEAITGQASPDRDVLRVVLAKLKDVALAIAVRVGERVAVENIVDFVDWLISML